MEEKLNIIYDYLAPQGIKNFPDTYEGFKEMMYDDDKASKIHSYLLNQNVKNVDNDFNAFKEYVGVKKKDGLEVPSEDSSTTRLPSSSESGSPDIKPIDFSYIQDHYASIQAPKDTSGELERDVEPKEIYEPQETLKPASDRASKKLERQAQNIPEKEEFEYTTDYESIPSDIKTLASAREAGDTEVDEDLLIPDKDEDGNIRGYYYKTTVPDVAGKVSTKEYIRNTASENSVVAKAMIGSLAKIEEASGINDDARKAYQGYQEIIREDIEKYKDPAWWEEPLGIMLGIVGDMPLFQMGGSLYTGTAKGSLKAASLLESKLIGSGLTKEVAKNIVKQKMLGTTVQQGVRMAGELGVHGALSDLIRQYGDASYEDIDYSETFKRLGYGSATGALVGFAGGFTNALGKKVADRHMAKAMTSGRYAMVSDKIANLKQFGVEVAGFPVEVGLFEVGNILENGVEGFSPEGLKKNAILLAMLKGKGKLMQLGQKAGVSKTDPVYKVDYSKNELDKLGFKKSEDVQTELGKKENAERFADVMENPDIPLHTKAKVLWNTKGIVLNELPTPASMELNKENLIIRDKDRNLLDEININDLPNSTKVIAENQRLLDHYNNIRTAFKVNPEDSKAIDKQLRDKGIEDGINNKDISGLLFKDPANYSKEDVKLLDTFNDIVKEYKGSVREQVRTEDVFLEDPREATKGEKKLLKTSDNTEVRKLQVEGKEAGQVIVDKGGDNWNIKRVDVEPDFQRRGIAKETYRQLNEEAKKDGKLLESDRPDKINPESKRIWESLVKSGEAEKLDNGAYRMREKPIEASEGTISDGTTKPTTEKEKPSETKEIAPKEEVPPKKVGGMEEAQIQKAGVEKDLAKRVWKKYMTAEGLLPREVFNEWVKSQSKSSAQVYRVEKMTQNFHKALKDTYGVKKVAGVKTGRPNVPKGELKKINEVLQNIGNGDTGALKMIPEGMRDIILRMREEIDALSQEMIREGLVTGELAGIFTENLGFYLNRSYRSHTDKSWKWENIPNEIRNNAINWLKSEKPELSREDLISEIKSYLDSPDGPFGVIRRGQLGAKDLSIFKKKKDIPKALRELMGEYEDPLYNYATSVLKMTDMIAKDEFLRNIVNNGKDKIFFEKPTGDFISQITTEGNPKMRPLSDKKLYTHPDIAKAFHEFILPASENVSLWAKTSRIYFAINGAVKYGKTVGSIQTHVRNFNSNFGFHMAHFRNPLDVASNLVEIAYRYKTQPAKHKEYIEDLISRGVVRDNARAGEILDVIRDVSNEYAKFQPGKRGVTKKALDFLTKLYQLEDDVHKIVAFESENKRYLNVYKKRHPNKPIEEVENMAKDKAAEIVRATMPTYSLIPEAVQLVRKLPVVGTFVSFPYEIFRTTFNSFDLIKQEAASADTRHLAAQRLAGIALASTVTSGAAATARHFTQVRNEDVKKLRTFLAPWNEFSDLVFIRKPENGVYSFIDLGYSDPHNYIKRMFNATINTWDDSPSEAFTNAAEEFFEPFLGEDLLFGTIADLRSNKKKGSGAPIYNEADTPSQQQSDIYEYFWKNTQPGLISSATRIYKSFNSERYDPLTEIGATFAGMRVTKVDVKEAYKYKTRDDAKMLNDAKWIYKNVLRDEGAGDKDKQDAYEMANQRIQEIIVEMNEAYRYCYELGVSPNDTRILLYDNAGSKRVARMVQLNKPEELDKRTGNWKPSMD